MSNRPSMNESQWWSFNRVEQGGTVDKKLMRLFDQFGLIELGRGRFRMTPRGLYWARTYRAEQAEVVVKAIRSKVNP